MRSASLLLLAACSTGARVPATTAADRDVAPVAAPAAAAPQVTASQTMIEHTDDAAAIRPVRTYALPAATASRLAKESVRGQVLVAGPLFPTESAAKALVSTIDDAQQPIAMRVIKDRGKVVQVTTTAAADCVDGFAQHYELSVFVPRSSLVPRTTTEITKSFEDGTAYAIDRGAPVRVSSAGVAWFDPMLDQTAAAPPERLAYSLGKPYVAATVPAAPGERLVCDGAPITKAEWLARKQAKSDRDAAKTSAALRRVADARASTRAAVKADAIDGLVDLALNDGTASAKAADAAPPYCTVAPIATRPVAAKLGGAAYVVNDPRGTDRVYRLGEDQAYLADVGATCARMRVAIDATAVRTAATATPSLRGARQKVWIPKPGPVFWPDGTKAGKYTGKADRFTRVTERDQLICVDVRGVAEEVCHRRDDVVVEN
ncbi:MAG: hypothetical protein IPQ07_39145 [Myxococcales bacterium]|nr:hypothetical protein [Myxococcales bacterium]